MPKLLAPLSELVSPRTGPSVLDGDAVGAALVKCGAVSAITFGPDTPDPPVTTIPPIPPTVAATRR